jgi:D-amino-acid dehydrogenase
MWKQVPRLAARSRWAARHPCAGGLPAAVLPWLLRFLRHSSPEEVVRIATALRGLLAPIFDCYAPLLERADANALVRRSGCLYVYGSGESARRWRGAWTCAAAWAWTCATSARTNSRAGARPAGRFRFGILAPENGSTSRSRGLREGAARALHRRRRAARAGPGVGLRAPRGTVRGVRWRSGNTLACDGVVVAAGAWSAPLAAARPAHPAGDAARLPRHRAEQQPRAAPHGDGARAQPDGEPDGDGPAARRQRGIRGPAAAAELPRADVLLAKGREMFPHLDSSRTTRWMGHRPCLPDSLPVIGRAAVRPTPGSPSATATSACARAPAPAARFAHLVAGRADAGRPAPFRPDRF